MTTTPHLDDEALSAALDGAATRAEEAHLASCMTCRAQMASLSAVARAIAGPVATRPAAEVDAAVDRALAEWTPTFARHDVATAAATSRGCDGGAGAGVEGPPVAFGPSVLRSGKGSPRWLVVSGGIAAAVLLVGVVVAVNRGSPAARSNATASLGSAATSATALPTSTLPVVGSGGDLGDQNDPSEVARLVTAALGQRASAEVPAAGATATPVPGVLPPSASPSAAGTSSEPACVANARAAVGLGSGNGNTGGGGTRFSASLRWQGQPAVVVVFSLPGGLAGAVMKTADCSVLAVLPF